MDINAPIKKTSRVKKKEIEDRKGKMDKARAHYARAVELSKERRPSKAVAHMRRAMQYGKLARLQRNAFGGQSRLQYATAMMSELRCPIKQSLMLRPVIIDSGHTYEYEAIMEWRKSVIAKGEEPKCPKTRQEFDSTVEDRSMDYVTKWFVGTYAEETGDEWAEIVTECEAYKKAAGQWYGGAERTALADATTLLPRLYGADTKWLMLEPTTILSGDKAGTTMERAVIPGDARSVRNVGMLSITRAFVAQHGDEGGTGWRKWHLRVRGTKKGRARRQLMIGKRARCGVLAS